MPSRRRRWTSGPNSRLPYDGKFEDEATKDYQGLLQDESNDPSLRYETAVGYRSLGYLNHKANDYQHSEKLYEKSIVILESLVSAFPENFEYQHQLAYSLMMLGDTLMAMNQMVNADTALERATGLYEKLFLSEPDDPDYRIELPNCYRRLLDVARDQRPLPEQQAVCQRVVDGLAKLPSKSTEGADVRAVLGGTLLNLIARRRRNRLFEMGARDLSAPACNPPHGRRPNRALAICSGRSEMSSLLQHTKTKAEKVTNRA